MPNGDFNGLANKIIASLEKKALGSPPVLDLDLSKEEYANKIIEFVLQSKIMRGVTK